VSLLLIDSQGQVWDGSSRQLHDAYDSPYSKGEFSDYAVVNLGFVAANVYSYSAQIRLRPTFTTDAACASLRRWLRSRSFDRVVLTCWDEGWRYEMLRSNQDALGRLDDLIKITKRVQPDEFLCRTLPEPTARDPKDMRSLFKDWPHLAANSSEADLRRLLKPLLGHRYVVVKGRRDVKSLVFMEFGGGIFANYGIWRSCAIGAPMEEQPDRAYGRWVLDAYNAAVQSTAPRLDQVDAIVNWPKEGRLRMRYKRLIVPIRVSDQEVHLLGGSVVDDRIDLRVTSGHMIDRAVSPAAFPANPLR
jgi:hypothetical protein